MKKINWWIDPFMVPLILVSFIVGYSWFSVQAGFVLAEYTFDPDSFLKRYLPIDE